MKIQTIVSTLSSLWLVVAAFSSSLRRLDAIGMPFLGGQ
jgi:hypothetical protein